jgi:dTDP-4-dehydrorhamnose reductase
MGEPANLMVFGTNGFLGSYVAESFQKKDNVYLCTRSSGNKLLVSSNNLLVKESNWDYESLRGVIHEYQPRVVINAIALTNASVCEKNPELAAQANSEIPEKLAKYTNQVDGRLVHISSDAVFGQYGAFFSENDAPHPTSVYGRTKLNGEEAVRRNDPKHLIIRTNFYGYHNTKPTLFNYFFENFTRNETAIGYKDVIFNPIYVQDLVLGINEFIKSELSGTIHFVGDEVLSKFEFGLRIARKMSLNREISVSSRLLGEIDDRNQRKFDLTLSNEYVKTLYSCAYDVNSGILEALQRAKVNYNELSDSTR